MCFETQGYCQSQKRVNIINQTYASYLGLDLPKYSFIHRNLLPASLQPNPPNSNAHCTISRNGSPALKPSTRRASLN